MESILDAQKYTMEEMLKGKMVVKDTWERPKLYRESKVLSAGAAEQHDGFICGWVVPSGGRHAAVGIILRRHDGSVISIH